jgi:phosphonate transport system ATP-binding protein
MARPVSPVVVLERVSKVFGTQRALDRISLRIEPGEFVAIIGRSGAGKTTFLRCLTRALSPTAGAIRFGDEDLAGLGSRGLRRHRARVGVIYQQFNLVRRLRVLDNVLLGRLPHLSRRARWLALFRHFPKPDREVAARCLDHVGLVGRAWQRTDTLSGGEQQRVAIAKILAQEPGIVLGDEPVASLDVVNGAAVMETLRRVATRAGVTVITTLHHVDYARRYADRVVAFRGGHLVFDGRPGDVTDTVIADIFSEAHPPHATPRAEPAAEPEWVPS